MKIANNQQHRATFRFYEELNDFLSAEKRKVDFDYCFKGLPSIKDAIEAIGVPHTEVDLILVNGISVDFNYQLQPGDRVAVYPMFELLDVSEITQLPGSPLREPKFILDVHLGKLARYLRMLGFDCLYEIDYQDPEIISLAKKDQRIILTRDIGILKHAVVDRGYIIRNDDPNLQLIEVCRRFNLGNLFTPFKRCLECNGAISPISKEEVTAQLPQHAGEEFDDFFICSDCQRVYWAGSHYDRMQERIQCLREALKK